MIFLLFLTFLPSRSFNYQGIVKGPKRPDPLLSHSETIILHHSVILANSNVLQRGEPVLILHGLLGSSRNFQNWAKLLYKKIHGERDIVIIDLRNHGRSALSGDYEMSYESMTLDLLATINLLKIEKAHVIGHSMGGKLAAAAALSRSLSDRIISLTLLDISPVQYTPIEFSSVADTVNYLTQISDAISRSASKQSIVDLLNHHFSDPVLEAFLLSNIQPNPSGHGFTWKFRVEGIAKSIDNIRCFPLPRSLNGVVGERAVDEHDKNEGGTSSTYRESYRGKTLIIKASNSSFVRTNHIPIIQQFFPSYILYTLKGAGHWLHMDQPDGSTEVVSKFLLSLSSPSSQ